MQDRKANLFILQIVIVIVGDVLCKQLFMLVKIKQY